MIAAFGGGESRRLAAEKTPCPRRGDCRGLPAETPYPRRRDCRGLPAETPYPRRRAKGDRTPSMVSCPLLTPLTFLCADTSEMCSETGLRGLGSVRRFAFGTLLCPEFSLRYPPRITVRGQTVQGGSVPLRKAPLPSSVDPWSTKRHCGPLAFRRATEGSRVLRRVWGSQEGAREPYGALAPFCPRRRAAAFPPVNTGISGRRRRPIPPCRGNGTSAARRRHFPKHRDRFRQRTNSPSIFQLSMFAIDIFYFPWYS